MAKRFPSRTSLIPSPGQGIESAGKRVQSPVTLRKLQSHTYVLDLMDATCVGKAPRRRSWWSSFPKRKPEFGRERSYPHRNCPQSKGTSQLPRDQGPGPTLHHQTSLGRCDRQRRGEHKAAVAVRGSVTTCAYGTRSPNLSAIQFQLGGDEPALLATRSSRLCIPRGTHCASLVGDTGDTWLPRFERLGKA